MGPAAKDHPQQYFVASAIAAIGCYPLWRSAAIGQSGFRMSTMSVAGMTVPHNLAPYVYGFLPPYKGMAATVFGMTYARATIFYCSDLGRAAMVKRGYSDAAATVVPPIFVSTLVQVVNQPIVRATVTLQDPAYNLPNVVQAVRHIFQSRGVTGLWHGTTAGVLKTVPKYCTAIAVKDYLEDHLPQPDPTSSTVDTDRLVRSAIKSGSAGIAGAALTNPLDVIRNEQFKTHLGFRATTAALWDEMGIRFFVRGLGKNLVAVALPVGVTIFLTDLLIQKS